MRAIARMCGGLLLMMLAAACGRARPPALIGLAYSPDSPNIAAARLAMSDLASARTGEMVRLLLDSSIVGDSAPVEVRRAEQLVAEPRLMTVIGPSNSRGALAAAPVYLAAGVSRINTQATSQLLSRLNGRTLNLIPNDSAEGAFIGRFIAESLRAASVTIFFSNDEYGIGLREGVESSLAARGVGVADKVPFSRDGDGAFDALVQSSLRRARPDAFVIAGRLSPTLEFARRLHALAPGVPIVAGDAALVPSRLAELGDSILGTLHVVSFWSPTPDDTAANAFIRRFRALTGSQPDPSDAYIYDGIMLSAEAIRAAGADRDAVWQWIRSLGTSHPPYQGVTGPIGFGTEAASPMAMIRIRDGRVEVEWPS